ncbi:MAG: DMT family transporter [Limnobacter sp.]|nr:DMT family transporter [Limnobacter sp.]
MTNTALLHGVGWVLLAGIMWGSVFIVPAILHDYPPAILSISRYLAFGLISLPLALAGRREIARLSRADWREAARLSLVGNLLYYGFLAAAIQLAGPPLPTMIIGALPVVIAIASNAGEQALPWRRLALSLAVIAAGILLVNRDELAQVEAAGDSRLLAGASAALVALACWTWYPIRNATWLRKRPGLRPDVWATAQGLTTLPLALAGWLAFGGLASLGGPETADGFGRAWSDGSDAAAGERFDAAASGASDAAAGAAFDWPLGPRPALFVSLMLAIGLLASWLGTLCWNRASQLLPTSLAGQLIVFETLSALAMGFAWRGQWPAPGTWAGVALLVAGVVLGVRAFRPRAAAD